MSTCKSESQPELPIQVQDQVVAKRKKVEPSVGKSVSNRSRKRQSRGVESKSQEPRVHGMCVCAIQQKEEFSSISAHVTPQTPRETRGGQHKKVVEISTKK
eukprot:GEMP01123096.1.p1 GENE.GEMP01123096.1~~GEMP01123096.1.p1  ORF type:complete len:101 (+),score=19.43 GEMP01123096.1:237-539(+)